ncbi:sigma 54-interacting transcriptional regulator [Clostridium aestuarii]|uniref:Sigma 54-interacting transcriptional regulator n=1 Tax=Clostridium aestuarii TaxID=338193 RepID=A0ABT4CZK8_9CLOT|nr:sigma 54-interacting transcriptional regulator [Clostridium aestuarii]MCY6484421.1 sigma 54-interacting transcriptional regulator [Clostridium aestuarii]
MHKMVVTNDSFKKFLTIIEHIRDGVMVINNKGIIMNFNKGAENSLGIKNENVIGEDISHIFPEFDMMKVIQIKKKETNKKIKINNKILTIDIIPMLNDEIKINSNKAEKRILGAVALIYDNTRYLNVVRKFNEEKHLSEILEAILEMAYDGIVVVNQEGYITMISKAYTEFLQLDREDVIGKHISDVIQNTRMHIVAQTGIVESAQLQKVNGRYMIATRIPLIEKGKVKGAVGKVLFRNIKDFNMLHKKISNLEKEHQRYRREIKQTNSAKYCFDNIIGESKKMIEAKVFAKKTALTNSNVLLRGESGTGKELFAHAIHRESDRAHGNFVKVNCAAIPSDLLESELFGYERGAFTGANKEGKIGKFELADGGTIFLDEIGDMPLHMQVKLLRVLQEKEVERVGSIFSNKIDMRVIAATNKNLEEMVRTKQFREDLYYRLNVVTIGIPSLIERVEDIPILVEYMTDKICKKLDKKIDGISNKVMEYLKNYKWYGNIRQLENVIERALNIVEYGGKVGLEHLPDEIIGRVEEQEIYKLDDVINKAEKDALISALNICNGNKTKASKRLNISRTTLYEKMAKHNILR